MIDNKNIWEVIEGNYHKILDDFVCFSFSGEDVRRFLGGQLTQDIKFASDEFATFSSRLNGKGQIVSWQILFEREGAIHALVERELAANFKQDLEKYIIMDDVEIQETDLQFEVIFGTAALGHEGPWALFYSIPAKLVQVNSLSMELKQLSNECEHLLTVYSAWPKWNKTLIPLTLVNETIFEISGISYSKGCFLGQETAAKIHTRRGASYAPALLIGSGHLKNGTFECMGRKGGEVVEHAQVENLQVYLCQLYREFRVDKLEIDISGQKFQVATISAPFHHSLTDWAQLLYDRGTQYFSGDREEEALCFLKMALELNPNFADAYEVVGVILGRHEKYQEAIGYMDKLSNVDPNSVMAHTNKSLYLMKLGKITEAEEEKSKATVKTFEKFGREAKEKRDEKQRLESEKVEIERRRSMFKQVLEIDSEDEIALYGLGDLAFVDQAYEQALDFFKRVLKSNPKHSRSYLMAGRCLEKLSQIDQARSMYQEGMSVATKAGELMPATEMRTRLVAIN